MNKETNNIGINRNKVYVGTGMITTYKNMITGLVSYAHFYLQNVNHSIDISHDGNDVVIIIRIRNVASKVQRPD